MNVPHKKAIQNRLLKWFDQKQRDLPWLHEGTPYHIWVSEIMLQQTQIATVIDYYHRFVKCFPNVRKLAAANVDDVLKLWEGLGYYRRARQLHLAAKEVVAKHDGEFPTDFDSVLALPGIGRYTAAAILSISLNQQHAILEGNTIRLFARLMGYREDTTRSTSQKMLWSFSESLLPRTRCGDFNQALMDFGREICKPKNPACDRCPLANFCPTFIQGLQSVIPLKGKKMQYEDLHEAIVMVKRNNKYLMRKCQPGERWAGLWDFPRANIGSENQSHSICESLKQSTGLTIQLKSLDKTIKHGVTRFRITLECFQASSVQGRLKKQDKFQWQSYEQVQALPLSSTGRKFADLFL